MSVVSRNPFDLLGDDGESSPAPAAKSTSTTTTAPKKATNASAGTAQRTVPGSAPRGGSGQRGGRYPSRGGPRNVYREDNGPRNTGPDPASGTMEGFEGAGGFEGERVAPPKRAHNGPDKHTKGPRENRRGNYTSGGHTSRGSGAVRGAKTPAGGAERRQFERKSGGLPDSNKKVEQGWGGHDGPRELDAEEEGEKDAQAEENAPQTPAGDDGGWGAPAEDAAAAEEETPAEPEEVQKSYDEFLAERAQQALSSGFGKKEGRTVNADTLEGKAFVREGIDDFFSGKQEKAAAAKAKAPKKEKVYIEVDGQFAQPARSGRGGERGGRGGARGGSRGDFRGGRGGDSRGGRGRGGPRGGSRGGFGARTTQTNIDGSDESAFPALGA